MAVTVEAAAVVVAMETLAERSGRYSKTWPRILEPWHSSNFGCDGIAFHASGRRWDAIQVNIERFLH
jgi:hypothetical protein